MQNSGNNHDNLTAAFIDDAAVIRVGGRGSFKVSPALKQFVHQIITRRSAEKIYLDMASCIGMDSTFMGVLAGLACYTESKSSIKFRLINLSDKNQKLLTTLGVDKVVKYSMVGSEESASALPGNVEPSEILSTDLSDKLRAAETALEAHETLVDINPENYDRFKSVLEYLEADVKNLTR
ncbi:MAG: STAS domain-containing protein [Kiritimatiellales bacterium]|nr:STAS domain-containing protein [Kiritimatiellales bacterium]